MFIFFSMTTQNLLEVHWVYAHQEIEWASAVRASHVITIALDEKLPANERLT